MNQARSFTLAALWALGIAFGSGSVALADHGHGHGHGDAKHRGSAYANGHGGTAHSCVNPAGNTRGWCKTQGGGTYATGTVTSINGGIATVMLSNGQSVRVSASGLTIGQQITLRGSYNGNGQFIVNGNSCVYTNYGGPYSGASVRGTIISVNGNSIQIISGLHLISIDASNAFARGSVRAGLGVGQSITAYGNWNGSTFVATSIQ